MARTELVSESNLRLIPAIIGPQLSEGKKVGVETSYGELRLEYCFLNQELNQPVFILVTGFGSGWTGITKLGCDLALRSYEVGMVSLPGYGNSDDPFSGGYIIDENRRDDAEVLAGFIKKILPGRKVNLVGHSMGAEIVVQTACRYPELVESLILLAPAGFEKRGRLEVIWKFIFNGIWHAMAFRGNPIWAEIKKFLPKEKSSYALGKIPWRISQWSREGFLEGLGRLPQRMRELNRLCQGNRAALRAFRAIPDELPILCVWGTRDFVFPMEDSMLFRSREILKQHLMFMPVPLWHNVTMQGSERVAEVIEAFFNVWVK